MPLPDFDTLESVSDAASSGPDFETLQPYDEAKEKRRKALQDEAAKLRSPWRIGAIAEPLLRGAEDAIRFGIKPLSNPLSVIANAPRDIGVGLGIIGPEAPRAGDVPIFTPEETVQTFVPPGGIVEKTLRTVIPNASQEKVIEGVRDFVGELGSSATTPANIAGLATGKAGIPLFAAPAIPEIPETVKRMEEASKRGDEAGVVKETLNLGMQVGGPLAVAKYGGAEVPKAVIPDLPGRMISELQKRGAEPTTAIETAAPQNKPLVEPISTQADLQKAVEQQLAKGEPERPAPTAVSGETSLPVTQSLEQGKGIAEKAFEKAKSAEPVTQELLAKEPGVEIRGEGPLGIQVHVKSAEGEVGTGFYIKPGATLAEALEKIEAARKRVQEKTGDIGKTEPTRGQSGLAKDVRAKLESDKASEAGFVNMDVLNQIVDFGKTVYQKGMDFATWSAEMIKHLGNKAADYLQETWNKLTTSAPATVDQLLKREPGHVSHQEIASLSPENASRYWEETRKQGIANQQGGVLAGMRMTEADLPALEALQKQAHEEAKAALKATPQNSQAFSAAMGKNTWASGAIEGVNRKGPNYELIKELQPKTEAPALNAQSGFFTLEPVERAAKGVRDFWRSLSMKSAPRLTDSSQALGEAAVRYESSPRVARSKGIDFAERVTQGNDALDVPLGTALTEDNLRGLREQFTKESQAEAAKGNTEKAAQLNDAASKVTTLIGKKNSPFKTEADYQSFLEQPATKEAIKRHIEQWEAEKDPLFRKANELAPETELASRGLQTGARVNLKNVMGNEGTPTTVGAAQRPTLIQQSKTFLRRDPFARRAKGTGQSYEGSYRELMAHGFEREYPVAMQHEFVNKLIENGDAVTTSSERGKAEVKGEATKAYELKLRPWAGARQWLHIRKSLANEYENISGLKPALPKLPGSDLLTKQAVMALAEPVTHAANLFTRVLRLGSTSNPMLSALLKGAGHADVLVNLPKVLVKAFTDQTPKMLELAEIGATKPHYKAMFPGSASWFLNRIDQGVRVVSADLYKKMAKKGWVEDSETGLREFVNQVGQYNKRLQPSVIRNLRDTGIQPFATAINTFFLQGLRDMTLAPGVKAPTKLGAIAHRAQAAAGWIGYLTLVVAINKLISGSATGAPGTRLGDIGWKGDDGKLHTFPLGALSGYMRGPRSTGIAPYIDARREGLPQGTAIGEAGKAVAGTAASYVTGPLTQFAFKAATGKRPGFPPVQEAKVVPPHKEDISVLKSQAAENIKTAVVEAQPYVDIAMRKYHGEGWSEILQSQLRRYTPRPGMDTKTIEALPKIVHSSELHNYVDGVARQARKLPQSQRASFIMKQLREDGLKGEDFDRAQLELHRKGLL